MVDLGADLERVTLTKKATVDLDNQSLDNYFLNREGIVVSFVCFHCKFFFVLFIKIVLFSFSGPPNLIIINS